jgi:hypothetical protein
MSASDFTPAPPPVQPRWVMATDAEFMEVLARLTAMRDDQLAAEVECAIVHDHDVAVRATEIAEATIARAGKS